MRTPDSPWAKTDTAKALRHLHERLGRAGALGSSKVCPGATAVAEHATDSRSTMVRPAQRVVSTLIVTLQSWCRVVEWISSSKGEQ